MTTKTTNELMEKLRSELPKKSAKAKRTTSEPSPTNGGAQRLSITVYPADLQRLDEIKHVMLREGVRNLSDSEALRLAVRTSATDASLLRKVYDVMILEDRRRV